MAANESGSGSNAPESSHIATIKADSDDKRAKRVAARREELLAEKRQQLATVLEQHDEAVCDL